MMKAHAESTKMQETVLMHISRNILRLLKRGKTADDMWMSDLKTRGRLYELDEWKANKWRAVAIWTNERPPRGSGLGNRTHYASF
ncbi:hypothetical protein Scep_006923 [Stephania cephalantha]|uniref:Uncharacterized protein n=1 Tax=Stephania cephalantha TaxID=152367 RepID=A0AAP0PPI4_9MAGN